MKRDITGEVDEPKHTTNAAPSDDMQGGIVFCSHLIKFTGERCGRGGRVLIFNTLPGSLSSIVWRIPSWRVLKKR